MHVPYSDVETLILTLAIPYEEIISHGVRGSCREGFFTPARGYSSTPPAPARDFNAQSLTKHTIRKAFFCLQHNRECRSFYTA